MQRSILTIFILFSSVYVLSLGIASCKKEPGTNGLTVLSLEIPPGFPAPNSSYTGDAFTAEGIDLGRHLFYDGRLSLDSEHSCSSCHQQVAAFGTFEHDRSHGVNHTHTLRNAPVLFNLAWSSVFHWDGAYHSLQDEAVQPIMGDHEMGENFETIIKRIQDDPYYRDQFKKVFKFPFIRPEFITNALAQFTGFMVSAQSKYDRVKAGAATFTIPEANGYQLFKDKCNSCHTEPLFTDFSYRNNGLPIDNTLLDYGRMRITNKKEDSLKFKVPTLRNVEVSSNYMHDGRFITLGQVLNHYRTNVQAGPTLDPLLNAGVTLTNQQASDLISFMRTLTDSTFLKNPRFSSPF
jgi:cytochrome c peroxidase